MPVLPQIQAILDAVAQAPPEPEGLTVAQRRARSHAGMERSFTAFETPAPESVTLRDVQVPTPDGASITLRVYTPPGAATSRPGHVYLHGGAWWLGELWHSDAGCANLAADTGCVVVSVAYRLAPEHPFPVPLEDCATAWEWVTTHAADLGIVPGRVSLGGSSAGGNLTAALCLVLRDRGAAVQPLCQVLDIPATDLTMSYPSVVENGEGYLLTSRGMREALAYYLPDPATQVTLPQVSPLHAASVADLPPTLLLTCEYDPLRDEGEAYGARLAAAGVPVEARRWEGLTHGAGMYTALLPQAREYHGMTVEFLRKHHGV